MRLDVNQRAFLALVKAGLWEQECRLEPYKEVDLNKVYQLAHEQSVIGLVAAGIEHVSDVRIPQKVKLSFVGAALQMEQRNIAMNEFVAKLTKRLREEGIHPLLVKGQGIAQCYARPLWRTSGDVDLLLNADDYEKAKRLLIPLATEVETEFTYFKHVGMTLEGWVVELHGTLQSRLAKRVDSEIDKVQECVFESGEVRTWRNGDTDVLLPAPDADVIFVFTHILHHYFFEGIGKRQLCDWCRLLWTYRDSLNIELLESRLKKMGLITEWKAFASYAVEWLGMAAEAMPLYSSGARWRKKASRINNFVLKVGNFGHNVRRNYDGMSYFVRKFKSACGRWKDMFRHFVVFPKDSIVFFGGVLRSGLHAAARGE